MLKLEGLKLAPEEKEAALHRRAARLLRIPEEDVLSVQVLRRSIDAREELHLVYTVAAEVRQEKQVLRRCRDRRVSRFAPERYALPEVLSSPEVPPVVVGAGPGGLFAALVLARRHFSSARASCGCPRARTSWTTPPYIPSPTARQRPCWS